MRRSDLKSIAASMLDSFVSRNNDVFGYWGIGKLCEHAQRSGVQSLHIDLLQRLISPPSREFDEMLRHFSNMLLDQILARQQLPSSIRVAKLLLCFNAYLPAGIRVPYGRGDPYSCALELVNDRGRACRTEVFSRVAPHDPRFEFRSAGERRKPKNEWPAPPSI